MQTNTAFNRKMEKDFFMFSCSMPIDEYYKFKYGHLKYRSIKFHSIDFPSPKLLPVVTVNFLITVSLRE